MSGFCGKLEQVHRDLETRRKTGFEGKKGAEKQRLKTSGLKGWRLPPRKTPPCNARRQFFLVPWFSQEIVSDPNMQELKPSKAKMEAS